MKKSIPPELDPPYTWGLYKDKFSGACANRERAILELMSRCRDREERKLLDAALRELYASAWQDDLPEEDREWAKAYRRLLTTHRQSNAGRSASKAYLESSGESESPGPRSQQDHCSIHGAWRAFAARVEASPERESDLAVAEAASRAYWKYFWVAPIPKWDGDPAQVHWLAAVRAAREVLATWQQKKS